jgi:hypothetical protein
MIGSATPGQAVASRPQDRHAAERATDPFAGELVYVVAGGGQFPCVGAAAAAEPRAVMASSRSEPLKGEPFAAGQGFFIILQQESRPRAFGVEAEPVAAVLTFQVRWAFRPLLAHSPVGQQFLAFSLPLEVECDVVADHADLACDFAVEVHARFPAGHFPGNLDSAALNPGNTPVANERAYRRKMRLDPEQNSARQDSGQEAEAAQAGESARRKHWRTAEGYDHQDHKEGRKDADADRPLERRPGAQARPKR